MGNDLGLILVCFSSLSSSLATDLLLWCSGSCSVPLGVTCMTCGNVFATVILAGETCTHPLLAVGAIYS